MTSTIVTAAPTLLWQKVETVAEPKLDIAPKPSNTGCEHVNYGNARLGFNFLIINYLLSIFKIKITGYRYPGIVNLKIVTALNAYPHMY